MNVEALTQVAEWLENGAKHVDANGNVIGFHMEYWYTSGDYMHPDDFRQWYSYWGTVMYIGGALEQFNSKKITEIDDVAAYIAGLGSDTAHDLLYPWESDSWDSGTLTNSDLTPQNCAKVIRHLIATGEVDWSIIAPAEEEISQ